MNTRLITMTFGVALAALSARAADPTVAFYTFNDAAPGTDATTVTITNSLDAAAYAGTSTKTTDGTVEFRADNPGAYILNGVDGATLAKNPQSIWFDGTAVAEGGQLSLASIMDTLAPAGMEGSSLTNAYTVEFFFMKPTTLTDYTGTTLVQVPRTASGGKTTILVPSDNMSKCRLNIPGANRDITMDEPLQDGKWHHMAITYEKPGKSPNHFMTIDYKTTTAGWPTGLDTGTTGPIVFGGGDRRFRGYISCVRVSHKKLTADQMLKASDSPLYNPGDDDKQVPAVTPKEGTDRSGNWWCIRHDAKLAEIAERGSEIETVFLGDSITALWESYGSDAWARFAQYHPLNIGYTADSTGHVLWRIAHGELDGYTAKVISILIGTNNLGGEPLRHTWRGVKAIVDAVREKQPQAKIILTSILPRGAGNDDLDRKIRTLNGELAKIADGESVFWLDIHDKFLNPDGTLNTSLYYTDKLHLFTKGYSVYADNLQPLFDDLYSGEYVKTGDHRPGTVAFYKFDDTMPGMCITNLTVKNAVDAARFAGTANISEKAGYEGKAKCEYSRERPGKYVFEGTAYKGTPLVTNPRSLFIDSSWQTPSGGGAFYYGARVQLADLATAIMSNDNYTVEFFYKIPTNASDFNSFTETFSWGLTGTACGFRLPAHQSGSTTMYQVGFFRGSSGKSYTYPNKLKDGKWHHIAAVRKAGKTTMYCDYDHVTDALNDAKVTGAAAAPFIIANGYRFDGYVSCLRVMTNALDVTQLLRASDNSEYCPRTICHWTFKGTPGEKLTTISNLNASAYATAFAGQYWAENLTGHGASSSVVCTNEYARKQKVVKSEGKVISRNEQGGGFPYTTSFAAARLPQGSFIQQKKGSFTIEAFFKFVGFNEWLARPGRPSTYCSFVGKPANASTEGTGQDFWFGFWVTGTGSLVGHMRTETGWTGWSVANTKFYDGKWHHYAYVYDEENLQVLVYFDYELVHTQALTGKILRSATLANDMLYLGAGGYSAGGYEGLIDEFRYSNGVLTKNQFLRTTGPGLSVALW